MKDQANPSNNKNNSAATSNKLAIANMGKISFLTFLHL